MFGSHRPRMRCWTCAAAIFVSAALLTLSLGRLEWTAFWSVLQGANPLGLLLALGIFGASLFFASWRWHLMLRIGGNAVHPGASVRSALIGHCAHTFLFGAVGGDVAKSWIYARWYRLKSAEVLGAAPLGSFDGFDGGDCLWSFDDGLGDFFRADSILFVISSLPLPAVWILGVTGIVVLTVLVVSRWGGKRFQLMDSFRKTLWQSGAKLLRDKNVLFQSGLAAFGVHACLSFTMAVCLASVSEAEIPWLSALWLFPGYLDDFRVANRSRGRRMERGLGAGSFGFLQNSGGGRGGRGLVQLDDRLCLVRPGLCDLAARRSRVSFGKNQNFAADDFR